MEQSNITYDHIALEAMKIIMDKTMNTTSTPLQRLRQWLGIDARHSTMSHSSVHFVAHLAYQFADAMMAEREKRQDGQGE